jgi:hypothetical protein
VREKFGAREKINKSQLARELGGIWKDRKDLGDTEKYLRKLRTDTRRKGMKNG